MSANYKKELEEKQNNIRTESTRVADKVQNIERLKEDKEKIEANLQKMKEMYLKANEQPESDTTN